MRVINKGTKTWTFPTELYLVPNVETEVPENLNEAVLSLPDIEVVVQTQEKRNKVKQDVTEVEDVGSLSN